MTILILLILSVSIFGQKDSLTVEKVAKMLPVQMATKVMEQDSTIKAKNETIKDCSAEVKHYADSLQAVKIASTKYQITNGIFGDIPIWKYLVGYFFALIGIIFMWLALHKKYKKLNPEVKLLSADNLVTRGRTFILSILTIFIVFRFAPQVADTAFSFFFALIVGLSIDYFTDLITTFRKVKLPDQPIQ